MAFVKLGLIVATYAACYLYIRDVSGYSAILQKDYKDKLDAEAVRLIRVILRNTKTMAQLIYDLIAFSNAGPHNDQPSPG